MANTLMRILIRIRSIKFWFFTLRTSQRLLFDCWQFSTNQSLAHKAKVYFGVCASHRLNLAVKILLNGFHVVLEISRKSWAPLHQKSNLAPVLCKSPTMVERSLQLLPLIGDIVPYGLQLSPRDNESANLLNRKLSDINVLTKELQDESLHIYQVPDYFDDAIEEFPEFKQHCSESSKIIVTQIPNPQLWNYRSPNTTVNHDHLLARRRPL